MDPKQKLIAIAVGSVCGLIIVALAVLLVLQIGRMGEAREARDGAESTINGYYAAKPYPSDANRKVREQDETLRTQWADKARAVLTHGLDVPQVRVSNGRGAVSRMAAAFYGYPARSLRLAGITGTKGKTTTSYLLKAICETAGHKCGLIGTTGNMIGARRLKSELTTPDPIELQKTLRMMANEGVEIVSMDYPSAYQALITGNCDVAALNPPTSYTAEGEGYVVTSSLSSLDVPQFDSVIVSNKAYTERRDVLVNYLKAFFQATDALQADPEMATQMLYDWYTSNGSETTLEACQTEIETRPFVTSEEAETITIGESVEVTGEFWVEQELLEESRFPEIATHIDDSLVKEALGF